MLIVLQASLRGSVAVLVEKDEGLRTLCLG